MEDFPSETKESGEKKAMQPIAHRMDCGVCHCTTKYELSKDRLPAVDRLFRFKSKYLKSIDRLKVFIRSILEYDGDLEEYDKAMFEAIKIGDIEALECLWQGMHFLGVSRRLNPAYDTFLIEAVAGANLKTIQHCFYAFQNYQTYMGYYAMSRQALLITCCHQNHSPDSDATRQYIMTLPHYIMACPYFPG